MVETLSSPLIFHPELGQTILTPERREPGYWAGCPSVIADGDQFLMTYRRRRPRGVGSDRGYACHVAQSPDGIHFSDIWSVSKEELSSPSMERFDIVREPDGYRLYISYVDPVDRRWRIDVIEAASPSGFTLGERKPVLTAANTGTEGVKDPVITRVGNEYWMFVSFASGNGLSGDQRTQAHASADIYNTGAGTFPTGLAISRDGIAFEWQGTALPVGASWDSYQARMTTVLTLGGQHLAFYDGSSAVGENYEERCGLASSSDLMHWESLTPSEPAIVSPHASGSVRYVDVLARADELWCYYECATADGSHETRLAQLPMP